ncbi:hypothetical protein BLNAU_22051 [Blattamonas nauphoetae]|uniref:Uncharacterized protein n=1 Tax=Blattamonas nauphoetae TaxID=2049346 RepID=A0ABQ9WU72_9EUKA|nr:hypothetical protein BLNAU_22051 [Blattamonas nauphoetae]
MKVKIPIYKWLQKTGLDVTDDGPGIQKGTVALSATTSLAFQNGTLMFDLLNSLAKTTSNRPAQQQLAKIKITRSQARIAITSNYRNLATVLDHFTIDLDDSTIESIANSNELPIENLLDEIYRVVTGQRAEVDQQNAKTNTVFGIQFDGLRLEENVVNRANTTLDLIVLLFENSFQMDTREIVELLTTKSARLQNIFSSGSNSIMLPNIVAFLTLARNHHALIVSLSAQDPPMLSFAIQVLSLGLSSPIDEITALSCEALIALVEHTHQTERLPKTLISPNISSTRQVTQKFNLSPASFPLSNAVWQWFSGQSEDNKTGITTSSGCAIILSILESRPCLAGHLSSLLLEMGASHLYDVLCVYGLQLVKTDEVKYLSLSENVLSAVEICLNDFEDKERSEAASGQLSKPKSGKALSPPPKPFVVQYYLVSNALSGVVEYAVRKSNEICTLLMRQLKQDQNATPSATVMDFSLLELSNGPLYQRAVNILLSCLSFLLHCWRVFPAAIETHSEITESVLSGLRFAVLLAHPHLSLLLSFKLVALEHKMIEQHNPFAVLLFKFLVSFVSAPVFIDQPDSSVDTLHTPPLDADIGLFRGLDKSLILALREPSHSALTPFSPFLTTPSRLLHFATPNTPLNQVGINERMSIDNLFSFVALAVVAHPTLPLLPFVTVVARRVESGVCGWGDLDILTLFLKSNMDEAQVLENETVISKLLHAMAKILSSDDVHNHLHAEQEGECGLGRARSLPVISPGFSESSLANPLHSQDGQRPMLPTLSELDTNGPFAPSFRPTLQQFKLIAFVFVHLVCKFHFLPSLTPLISNFIRSSLLLLLSSHSFVLSLLNSQTQKENKTSEGIVETEGECSIDWIKDHSHSILVDCIVGLGCTSRTVPSSSSVSLIADANRPDAKTAMTQFSSCVGMNVVRSLLILKQRSKEMFEMKIALVDDDLGASGSDHGDMNESGATAEHAFVLLVSFVFTRIKRNKGKIRLPQPSPIKQPAPPTEGSPLPPSVLDLVSRFSLWTLITRLPPASLVASQTSLPPTLTSSPKKKRVRDTKDQPRQNEVEEKLVDPINQIELTGGSIFRLWEMCLNETEPGVLFLSVEEVGQKRREEEKERAEEEEDSEEEEEHDEEEEMNAEFDAQAAELFLKITEEEEKRMIEEREKEKDRQQSDEEDKRRREQLKQERLERKRSQEERKQKLEEKKRKIAELTSQLMLMENRRQEALADSNDADVSQFLEAEKKQRMQIERMLKECKSDETEIEDEEAAIQSLSIEDEVEAELPPLPDLPPKPKDRKEIVMWEIQAAKRKHAEKEREKKKEELIEKRKMEELRRKHMSKRERLVVKAEERLREQKESGLQEEQERLRQEQWEREQFEAQQREEKQRKSLQKQREKWHEEVQRRREQKAMLETEIEQRWEECLPCQVFTQAEGELKVELDFVAVEVTMDEWKKMRQERGVGEEEKEAVAPEGGEETKEEKGSVRVWMRMSEVKKRDQTPKPRIPVPKFDSTEKDQMSVAHQRAKAVQDAKEAEEQKRKEAETRRYNQMLKRQAENKQKLADMKARKEMEEEEEKRRQIEAKEKKEERERERREKEEKRRAEEKRKLEEYKESIRQQEEEKRAKALAESEKEEERKRKEKELFQQRMQEKEQKEEEKKREREEKMKQHLEEEERIREEERKARVKAMKEREERQKAKDEEKKRMLAEFEKKNEKPKPKRVPKPSPQQQSTSDTQEEEQNNEEGKEENVEETPNEKQVEDAEGEVADTAAQDPQPEETTEE